MFAPANPTCSGGKDGLSGKMIFPFEVFLDLVGFLEPDETGSKSDIYEEVYVMKKFLSGVFVFLLMTSLLASVAASPASAAAEESGYTTIPWYLDIDKDGDFINDLPSLFQNSAQYVIYSPGFPSTYILAAHPNYAPSGDDPTTAESATFVTEIQRYNADTEEMEDCTVGGTFQVPGVEDTYVRYTDAGIPYLTFSITFTTYKVSTGAVAGTYSFDPVYFSLDSITPPTAPPYGSNK
jgi:hypothetical protein